MFDLTIANNHNFALDVGVFVHNSKDEADAVCGSIYNASQHAEEFAFEFGEDIENMLTVSSNSEYKERKQI
uniref:DNA polymerase III, alpha subunit-structure, naturally occurring, TRANSFERASE.5A n=1 Tax=virus sp. ctnRj46 TaxID=2826814 RepID=A0A8S5R6Y3_9VIRU|nr:MAG TPA: DNA polymerase III, alpha subunit-structure, naturally occurring, TRANSFERASE.5A [virus sp. ctnRj46]